MTGLLIRIGETATIVACIVAAVWIVRPGSTIEAVGLGFVVAAAVAIIQHATGLTYLWGHDEQEGG